MRSYRSRSGKPSGVEAYQTGIDRIVVKFAGGEVYTYSYTSAGKATIEKMKKLAEASEGLSTFIAQHQPGYEK